MLQPFTQFLLIPSFALCRASVSDMYGEKTRPFAMGLWGASIYYWVTEGIADRIHIPVIRCRGSGARSCVGLIRRRS